MARRATDRTVFLVFGMGMGHVARALRDQSEQPVVVFEPDVGILRTLLEYGPTDLGGVQVITSLQSLMGAWVQIGTNHLDAIIARTPGYAGAYPAELIALPTAVHEIFQRIGITQNTYEARARAWVDDILGNLETIIGTVPFLALAAKYRGVPAFIVGAGPSLDKNVALVEEATKKGIVFCVNSSTRSLAKRGVVPHVLACIESIDSSELLAGLPFIDQVIRAFSLSAAPNILRTGKGPLLPTHELLPQFAKPLEQLTGAPGVAVCGSVSTAAFSLAHALGCSPIVLLGQDLAYTSGRTHASGSFWEDSRATVSKETGEMKLDWSETLKKIGHRHGVEPLAEIPAWGGQGTVYSGVSFSGIRGWFESAASMLTEARQSVHLVNATEGGGRIEGFEERPLRDVLSELPELGITGQSMAELAHAARPAITREHVAGWVGEQAVLTAEVRRAARRLRRVGVHALAAIRTQDAYTTRRARGSPRRPVGARRRNGDGGRRLRAAGNGRKERCRESYLEGNPRRRGHRALGLRASAKAAGDCRSLRRAKARSGKEPAMSLTIPTNVASLETQKNLAHNQAMLAQSFNRLSSGFRINTAADDAAGLAISESMKSQIRSYVVSERNANDAISMVQTAEGALGDVQDIASRMRELAVQASNGSFTSTDRGYMNTEYSQLKQELTRIQGAANGLSNTTADQLTVTFGGFALTALVATANTLAGTTASSALAALSVIDTAMTSISTQRAKYGASMNRLGIVTASIQTMRLNISAANSRIRDVDVAEETSMLARNQVLSQAGVSVLSQANQIPNMALGLLGR